MKVSPAGVALIKEFEGFPYGGRPYRDVVGVWTIGYGHTAGVSASSHRLTEAQASALLARDLDEHYGKAINGMLLPLTQPQFDALVSFVYNCGPGAVGPNTGVGRALRAHQWNAAADHLLDWDKAGGRALPGLTRRRQAERRLFLSHEAPASLPGYSKEEVRWIREYDKLVRENRDPDRRRVLRRVMTEQRQRIWKAAQPKSMGGDGKGWHASNRTARYNSLKARTT